MVPSVSLTAPPLAIVSVAVPEEPITRLLVVDQVEPAPVTVTLPLTPFVLAMTAEASLTPPPFEMVNVPAPYWLTVRLPEVVHDEPDPVTVTVPVEP